MMQKEKIQHKDDMTITLPSDKEVLITRTLHAPRNLVFEAMTEPRHLRQWLGPRAMTMTVADADLRVGGAWRFIHRAPRWHGPHLQWSNPRIPTTRTRRTDKQLREYPKRGIARDNDAGRARRNNEGDDPGSLQEPGATGRLCRVRRGGRNEGIVPTSG